MRKYTFAIVYLMTSFFCGLLYAQESDTNIVNDLIERADFMLSQNRYQDAIALLDKAVSADPKNAQLNFKKANTYSALGQFDKAIEELKETVKKDDSFYDAYGTIGDLYAQSKKIDEAVKYYHHAFESAKDTDTKYLYKLKVLAMLDQAQKTRKMYTHIEDVKKIMEEESFEMKYYEAMYWNELGEYEKALNLMSSIMTDISPVSGTDIYYYQYTYALYHLEKYKEVKTILTNTAGSAVSPKLSIFTDEFHFNMADAYYRIQDYSSSLSAVDICLHLNGSHTKAAELKKKLIAVQTNKSSVIEAYKKNLDKVQSLKEKSQKVLSLAKLCFESEDYNTAMMYIDEYQDILPDNARDIKTVFLRGVCEMKTNEIGRSLQQMDKVIHNPKFSKQMKVMFNLVLGIAYKNVGDYRKAEGYLKDAYAGPFRDVVKYEFELVRKLEEAEDTGAN